MLAQNFKTAADLHITNAQHDALRLTLNALEREELKHSKASEKSDPRAPFTGHFNMSCWHASNECGTICCIGGTAELLGKLPVASFQGVAASNGAIAKLFYPPQASKWSQITTDQAARAIRSYLTTGEANWAEALA